VSRTRFQLGRNTETHNEQSTREPVPGAEIIVHILPSKKLNFIYLLRLQIEMHWQV
jgi:hypothetical protein